MSDDWADFLLQAAIIAVGPTLGAALGYAVLTSLSLGPILGAVLAVAFPAAGLVAANLIAGKR